MYTCKLKIKSFLNSVSSKILHWLPFNEPVSQQWINCICVYSCATITFLYCSSSYVNWKHLVIHLGCFCWKYIIDGEKTIVCITVFIFDSPHTNCSTLSCTTSQKAAKHLDSFEQDPILIYFFTTVKKYLPPSFFYIYLSHSQVVDHQKINTF